MPNKNLYICVCPEVCAIKANGYDIVKKSTFERHEVTRQHSTVYSTYPVHHLHGQHVTDDMLTMFGQSESQITEAMEVDSSRYKFLLAVKIQQHNILLISIH
ncbi:hypothetical protein RO3G_14766 [Rhizopus delemar RA 99-880]|uniref:Uncharacterized protein n=1 Tax=Rhizopus delemar (strain RA 99-880 / ATCC MYA-4621 / FGSC 9543 / NRRL 43880) TaxID=246409 RepID=I1CNM5_RHIO9|nr:hypothetical protein RO3G_14766 [Rhizopus delemar RA 99-880]|eukprot:EIE90055.1 hypothetical protein RO3G_14766 [Rhizopus delemar RA 99-880]